MTWCVMVPDVCAFAPSGMAVTVMVKTCWWPTSLTALGAMAMLASTKFFTAGPLPPGPKLPAVSRVTVTPPMVTWAEALAVKLPAVLLLMVSVQVATLSRTLGAAQVVLWLPGAGLTLGVMVPKLTGLAPSGMAVTVMVKTCWW